MENMHGCVHSVSGSRSTNNKETASLLYKYKQSYSDSGRVTRGRSSDNFRPSKTEWERRRLVSHAVVLLNQFPAHTKQVKAINVHQIFDKCVG